MNLCFCLSLFLFVLCVVTKNLCCEHLELKLGVDRGSCPFVERNLLLVIGDDLYNDVGLLSVMIFTMMWDNDDDNVWTWKSWGGGSRRGTLPSRKARSTFLRLCSLSKLGWLWWYLYIDDDKTMNMSMIMIFWAAC